MSGVELFFPGMKVGFYFFIFFGWFVPVRKYNEAAYLKWRGMEEVCLNWETFCIDLPLMWIATVGVPFLINYVQTYSDQVAQWAPKTYGRWSRSWGFLLHEQEEKKSKYFVLIFLPIP